MAKGYKASRGGGASLNFKVVGNPQPVNPSPSTIWLNTDRKITGYYFSATQPKNMAEGEVWFSVGTYSAVAFSVTKKNPVMVYPISAKQYVDGALVSVPAKSYHGGEWVDWMLYLFNSGDECTDVTGGWSPSAYNLSGEKTAPTLTINGSTMTIAFRSYTAGSTNSQNTYYNGSVWTKNAIDLSDMSTLEVKVDSVSNVSDGYFQLHLVSEKKSGFSSASVASKNISKTGTHTLDVSSLSGSYYVVFVNKDSKQSMTVGISEILAYA